MYSITIDRLFLPAGSPSYRLLAFDPSNASRAGGFVFATACPSFVGGVDAQAVVGEEFGAVIQERQILVGDPLTLVLATLLSWLGG